MPEYKGCSRDHTGTVVLYFKTLSFVLSVSVLHASPHINIKLMFLCTYPGKCHLSRWSLGKIHHKIFGVLTTYAFDWFCCCSSKTSHPSLTHPINSFRPVPAFNAVIHFSSLSVVNQSPLNKTAKAHCSEICEGTGECVTDVALHPRVLGPEERVSSICPEGVFSLVKLPIYTSF